MNIIDKVSIGGYAFSLVPGAKSTLEAYLNKIKAHYRFKESGNEIVEGIEDRIAELLLEKCGSGKVVAGEDIDSVIKIMGYPEDMDETETGPAKGYDSSAAGASKAASKAASAASGASAADSAASWASSANSADSASASGGSRDNKGSKRLYRDPKHGVIGGVCSGLAGYFNVDVVVIRLIFVALIALTSIWHGRMLLTMPLIYIVMLIAMPAAKTVQERWALKGDDGTVGGVEKNVRSGSDSIETATRSQFWSIFGRVCNYCIGVLLLIVGVSGLVALAVGMIMGPETWLFGCEPWQYFVEEMPEWAAALSNHWAKILLLAIVAIPFIGLLWGGIQLCFHLRNPKWHPGLILFMIWLIAAVALAAMLAITLIPPYFIV